MQPDSDALYYAKLYTQPELQQLRGTACAELATLSTAPAAPSYCEELELTSLLDRIRLYTAALLVLTRNPQLA